jgi:hypothetical protein
MLTYIALCFPKKYYNNAREKFSKPIKYSFTEDYLYVKSNAENISGSFKINYHDLRKIYETGEALYIYTNKTSACILEKKDFNSEKLQLLRRFLQNKFGNMYF